VLLGDGVRLFDQPGGRRTDLVKTSAVESGKLTDPRFRVARPQLSD
jgi:hypothetical protein